LNRIAKQELGIDAQKFDEYISNAVQKLHELAEVFQKTYKEEKTEIDKYEKWLKSHLELWQEPQSKQMQKLNDTVIGCADSGVIASDSSYKVLPEGLVSRDLMLVSLGIKGQEFLHITYDMRKEEGRVVVTKKEELQGEEKQEFSIRFSIGGDKKYFPKKLNATTDFLNTKGVQELFFPNPLPGLKVEEPGAYVPVKSQ